MLKKDKQKLKGEITMNGSVIGKIVIFAVGAGIGFFVSKKIYEEYYASIAQEEIDSVKQAFENYKEIKPDKSNGMNDEEYEKDNKKVRGTPGTNSGLVRSSLDGNKNEQAKRNYNLVRAKLDSNNANDNEVELDEPVTDAAGKTEDEMKQPSVDRTRPYIIDDREFEEEFDHHDKVSLYYYRVDDVLCDESEEVFEDLEENVGLDAIAALDMQTTVWVRNEPLCIDYEIVSINGSYAETVQGIGIQTPLSPREEYERKQKRREQIEK
jgi:hypothetical protein